MDEVLESLGTPRTTPAWSAWTAAAVADYARNREHTPVEPMDLAVVVKTLERLAPQDTVYTNGAGNYSGWLHRYLRYRGLAHTGKTQLAPTSGAMGYGLPAAVAASLTQPGRVVVNLAGDGDFLMNGQEMATATGYGAGRQGAPLISIVVDNGSYGTIRMHQERDFPGRVSGSDLYNPDFAALARAYGWAAERVERTEDFESAFARALRHAGPSLIHLVLPTDVITSRTTLQAIRAAALKRHIGG
jgi:acetolactate synthase-1/2/3 large subunit